MRLVASIFDATALHVRELRSCLLGLGLAVPAERPISHRAMVRWEAPPGSSFHYRT